MKDNFEVIHYHTKNSSVQDLISVHTTFEKCTKKFCFENGDFI